MSQAYPPEKAGQPAAHVLPTRSTGMSSATTDGGYETDEEALTDTAPSDTVGLLLERLQAWKHACGYLENYVAATGKCMEKQSKEYDRVMKTISDPLKEGSQFDQALGGIAGYFESMRSNTQGVSNSFVETAKNLDGSVMPILKRLHGEIKAKHKEVTGGAGKTAKSIDQARNESQKYIEALGEYGATFDSAGGKIESQNDPYVLHRQIQYRLHQQVMEENNGSNDLLAVQKNVQEFEAHVIQTLQQAMTTFLQFVGAHADRTKAMYSDMVGTLQRVPLDFEWNAFVKRRSDILIDPNAPMREVKHIKYPNEDHPATKPLLAGTLERKSRGGALTGGYKTGYYAVTPARYLHQFVDDDNFRHEPSPELSLFLPDCTLGAVNETKFHVKGKDVSKGKVGQAFTVAHELSFKAHTPADAQQWHDVIAQCMGAKANTTVLESNPTSPTASTSNTVSPVATHDSAPQHATQPSTAAPSTATTHPSTTAVASDQMSGTTARQTTPSQASSTTAQSSIAPDKAV